MKIVSLILIVDGLRVLIRDKIYGKVRMSTTVPLEGWYVHLIGGIELGAGLYLCYRLCAEMKRKLVRELDIFYFFFS